jgi:hypothetical protein
MSAAARILMTGSRNWTDRQTASDALNASLALLGSGIPGSTLVHGAAKGADALLAEESQKIGMTPEAHPAQWNQHTDACPAWDRANASCKLAGFRRNTEMIRSGADLCLAFPTHGYVLAPGESRTETSRGTWNCAEEAKKAGIPTLVVWGSTLYPFGDAGADVLRRDAQLKGLSVGHQGQVSIVDAWLPF